MKRPLLLAATFACCHWLHAQNVGINTITPHPSALLDIKQVDVNGVDKFAKGVLFPGFNLQSNTANPGISNPAHNLILFHQGSNLQGEGLYYNGGTEGNPNWLKIGGIQLPYTNNGNSSGSLFKITNSNAGNLSSAVQGVSTSSGVGVFGESKSGAAVYGESESGTGVYAVSETGNALNVKGKIRLQNNGEGVGKVLTSDANGNASWQAPGNGGGSLPNVAFSMKGVFTNGSEVVTFGQGGRTVHFHTQVYDIGNNFNAAIEFPQVQPISNFKAPYHGIYHFDVSVSFASGDMPLGGQIAHLMIKRGNNTFNEAKTESNESSDVNNDIQRGTIPLIISKDVELQVGDLVSVFVQYALPGSYIDENKINWKLKTGDEETYFTGRLVMKLD